MIKYEDLTQEEKIEYEIIGEGVRWGHPYGLLGVQRSIRRFIKRIKERIENESQD